MHGAMRRSAARTAALVCLVTGASVTFAQQQEPKKAFLQAVDAAGAARDAALETTKRDYDRVAAALETASAALTPDARRRLETGPLAEARRARSAGAEAVQLEWGRRIEVAVRNYAPAIAVWDALKQTVSELRIELAIYAAVTEAADFAVAEASSTANAADRAAAGQARDVAALEARIATAKARYEAADRAYQATVQRRPQEVEAEGFGAERFGAFVQGLGARLGGDEDAFEATDRDLEEILQAQLDAIAEADAVNEAAEGQYDAAVAEARAEREEAYAVYQTATDAARRTTARTVGADEAQQSASRNLEATLQARRSTFLHAAKATRVYSSAELSAMERALTQGALAAIAELDVVALARIPEAAAREILYSSLETYNDPRTSAFDYLDRALADYDRVAQVASEANTAVATTVNAINGAREEGGRVLGGILERYYEARNAAMVQYVETMPQSSDFWRPRGKKAINLRKARATDLDAILRDLRSERRKAVVRSFPGIEVIEPDYPSRTIALDSEAFTTEDGNQAWSSSYERAESDYAVTVASALDEYTEDAQTLRDLKNRAATAIAARDAAGRARNQAFARAESLVAFDPFDQGATNRIRALKADVRARILRARSGGNDGASKAKDHDSKQSRATKIRTNENERS